MYSSAIVTVVARARYSSGGKVAAVVARCGSKGSKGSSGSSGGKVAVVAR